jgi:hypothetical protein
MRILTGIALVILILTTNQASGNEALGAHYTEINPYVTLQPTVTPNAPARANYKKIVKSKIVHIKVHRYIAIDDDDSIFVQDEDLATGYRRRDLNKIEHPDGISEYVRWRLFLARQLALQKYREIHG